VETNNLTSTKPILYLGKDRVNGAFYFLGDKDGVGRFLKFLTYPMWCTSNMIGNFLDIGAEVPTEVLAEIMLFINGVVNYELLPAKQGRAETVVRTDFSTGTVTRSPTKDRKSRTLSEGGDGAAQIDPTSNKEPSSTCGKGSGSPKTEWPFPNFGINDTRRGNVGSAPVDEQGDERIPDRRKRSSSNPRILDSNRDLQVKSEANTVQTEHNTTTKTLASENGDQPVKKRRGRPPKALKTPD
jgi:hypothetical protein